MQSNTRLGILYMVATTLVFALQDGFSQYLSSTYNVYLVVMIRYWFFAAFVIAITARRPGGIQAALKPRYPILQILRGTILAIEICVMVTAFTILGLIESHAVFACYPLWSQPYQGPFWAKAWDGDAGLQSLLDLSAFLSFLNPAMLYFHQRL